MRMTARTVVTQQCSSEISAGAGVVQRHDVWVLRDPKHAVIHIREAVL